MNTLPMTHITLYKHGVGFFERRAAFAGEQTELSFRVEEMNDILKSLTVIDWGAGQVLGVDYATPQSLEERLAGCSVRLDAERSLRDLLTDWRGRRVRLTLTQQQFASGLLLGVDELSDCDPLANSLVSILLDDSAQVQTIPFERLQQVEILDERGANDLRFFLHTSLSQENYRQVTIRLTPGEHDLSVSYIAPAPTWRVSYRLVVDSKCDTPHALLQGWGIFDNRLEEDLQGISLSLVAGMPISFVYDLYTPFTPERPKVQEEARVAAAPVEFDNIPFAMEECEAEMPEEARYAMAPPAAPAPMRSFKKASLAEMKQSAQPTAKGEALGELFQYNIGTPVTVGRGQSAMVPIISADLTVRKDLLYNGAKMPAHPVATLRLKNATGLTLERGPVTVLDNSEYVGEAVLPFTAAESEIVVPYAVELGVKIKEENGSKREMYGLRVQGAYLYIEEWDVRWRLYQLNNSASQKSAVLIEHPRSADYELFKTADPKETTADFLRFEVAVPARKEATLRVQERRAIRRYEELKKQSFKGMQQYLREGLIDQATHDSVAGVLKLCEQISEQEKALTALDKERQKIYKAQQQIQGKEGELRTRYVEQLEVSEEQLKILEQREARINNEIATLKAALDNRLEG